jgi:ankyrin repeat protein
MKCRKRRLAIVAGVVLLLVLARAFLVGTLFRDEAAREMSRAAYTGRTSLVLLWLVAGASPNHRFAGRDPAIHVAASRNDIATLKLLLWSGADPNLKAKFDITPLWHAEKSHATEAADLLRSRGGYSYISPGAP